jgi:hypothetical protein
VVAAAVAVEIIRQVELVTVLLPMLQILAVLAQLHLQQDFVETTIQAHNIAELLTVLVQVLNKIILALLVFAGTTRILFQKLLVTILLQTNALRNKEAVVVKLLQAELVIALVQIFQILAVLAQAHLNLAHVVITIQAQMLVRQLLTLGTAQHLFKALE